ncbi:MAG: hypothetical protein GYA57_10045, partial [Myxococcales bacterium]|nr:hypothetical protein [Myxococcales bacterium]
MKFSECRVAKWVALPLAWMALAACNEDTTEPPITHHSIACEADGDCGPGMRCNLEYCGRDPGGAEFCVSGGVCEVVGGGCAEDTDCGPGMTCELFRCDPATGTDERCYAGGVCVPSTGGCTTDADCGPGFVCDAVYCGAERGADEYCLGGGVCVPAGGECTADTDCAEGYHCEMVRECADVACEGTDCPEPRCFGG